MGSFNSSALRKNAKPVAVSAFEGLFLVGLAASVCGYVWRSPNERFAIAAGLATAWLVSTLGAAAIMIAKTVSSKAFWWAFGGGMAARFLTLFVLMAWTSYDPGVAQQALLLSYVFGVLAVLLTEYRHIKLK